MAVIQFSVPSDVYVQLVERGAEVGLSENQFAKALTLIGLEQHSNAEVLKEVNLAKRARAESRLRATIRPIA